MSEPTVQIVTDMRRLEQLIASCRGTPTRLLHDGVLYGVFQEFGTYKMAAHPFIVPALEAVAKPFREGLKQIKNLEDADVFVDKVAHDAEAIAYAHAPVDTGALRASIRVSRPEEFGA